MCCFCKVHWLYSMLQIPNFASELHHCKSSVTKYHVSVTHHKCDTYSTSIIMTSSLWMVIKAYYQLLLWVFWGLLLLIEEQSHIIITVNHSLWKTGGELLQWLDNMYNHIIMQLYAKYGQGCHWEGVYRHRLIQYSTEICIDLHKVNKSMMTQL